MVSQDPVPLDPVELEKTLRPFGESRMLPLPAYTAAEVHAWERRNFFDRWTCVATSGALPKPGSQRAEATPAGGVLLSRDKDGQVRAFANACRHRGHELLPCGESADRALIRCPYHSWTYQLDGTLNRAPGFDGGATPGFDPADNALVELAAEEWHGLIFVHGTARPVGSFADHVAGLGELIAPWEMGRLQVGGHHDYVVAANWKVLTENYQECYHCPVIHPELCSVSPPESGENYLHPEAGAWVGGWMNMRDHAVTMSLDGSTSAGRPLRGLDEEQRRHVLYLGLFPNLLISLHPDYVMTHILTPLAADRTRIRCAWSFAPEDLGRADFDPAFAIDFWHITNEQDWKACESVQRGLSHPGAVPGVLSTDEDAVYQFVTLVGRGYAGLPLTTAPVGSAERRDIAWRPMKAEWTVVSRRLGTLLVVGALLAGCGTSSPLAASTTTAPPTTATTTTTVPPTTTTTVAPKKKPKRKRPTEVRQAVGMATYDDLATIPPATLAAAAKALPGTGGIFPTAITGSKTAGGKPTVLVIGAEWCPYCAAENWSLVIALSQFGTFKGLASTDSSSSVDEPYRSVPGFTFYRSSYASSLLDLHTYELADVAERRLQRPTAADSHLMSRYDKLGGIPFVYLGGLAYLEGSGVNPKLLVRHTFGGAANGIVQGTSPLARSVEGNAGVLISYLCQLTHGQPGAVCKSFPKVLTS